MSYQNPEDVEVQPLGGQPELEAVVGLLRDLGLGGHPPVLRPSHTCLDSYHISVGSKLDEGVLREKTTYMISSF